ncbi:hypothetical protein AAC387_Pa10g1200 [Persea americana]
MSSFISFLSPQASLLSYAPPNPTKLRMNPWKPYLLPIHGGISSSSAATMSHDSRQKPIAEVRNLEYGSGFDPYASFYPESDVMKKLLRGRMVFLLGKIDGSLADMIIFQLMMLDFEDPTKDIKLFINTVGWTSQWPALAIYNAVQFVKADVSTIALGSAGLPTSIILFGGTKGKRLAMPNARIEPQAAIKNEIQPKKAMQDKKNVTTVYTFDQEQTDRMKYLSPVEAVEYGMIDGIIDRDYLVSLLPAAEKAEPKVNYEGMDKDPSKFLTPLFSDAEI